MSSASRVFCALVSFAACQTSSMALVELSGGRAGIPVDTRFLLSKLGQDEVALPTLTVVLIEMQDDGLIKFDEPEYKGVSIPQNTRLTQAGLLRFQN